MVVYALRVLMFIRGIILLVHDGGASMLGDPLTKTRENFESTKTTNRTMYLNQRQKNVRSEIRTKEIKQKWEQEDRLRQEKLQKKGKEKK